MSIALMNRVWEKAETTKPAERLVLLALADFAGDDGRCWPSLATLADKCRMEARYLRRVLSKLVSLGLLKIVQSGRGRKASVYEVTPDCPNKQGPEAPLKRVHRPGLIGSIDPPNRYQPPRTTKTVARPLSGDFQIKVRPEHLAHLGSLRWIHKHLVRAGRMHDGDDGFVETVMNAMYARERAASGAVKDAKGYFVALCCKPRRRDHLTSVLERRATDWIRQMESIGPVSLKQSPEGSCVGVGTLTKREMTNGRAMQPAADRVFAATC